MQSLSDSLHASTIFGRSILYRVMIMIQDENYLVDYSNYSLNIHAVHQSSLYDTTWENFNYQPKVLMKIIISGGNDSFKPTFVRICSVIMCIGSWPV